jgi:superfamily II DNA/RNA helicase
VVFEESDRTLDMGFKREIEESFNVLRNNLDLEKI